MKILITISNDDGHEIFSADRDIGGDDRISVEPIHDEESVIGFALSVNGEQSLFGLQKLGLSLTRSD